MNSTSEDHQWQSWDFGKDLEHTLPKQHHQGQVYSPETADYIQQGYIDIQRGNNCPQNCKEYNYQQKPELYLKSFNLFQYLFYNI